MSKKKRAETKKEISQEWQSEVVRPFEEPLKKHLIPIFILLAITVGVYFNSLFNGFVYDDRFTITNNLFIRDWNNLTGLFSKDYFSRSGEATYRPVVTLSYFIDCSLWGLKPFGYHFTNVLLHLVNVVFVYLFVLSLLKQPPVPLNKEGIKGVVSILPCRNRWIAFLTALLFSIHPVQTEAVNAISFREDLLVVFFLLPAFLLFLKVSNLSSTDKIRWWTFYILSLLLYLLALFSKEMAITFLLLLIGYLLCFGSKDGRQERRTFIYLSIGYVAVTLIYLLLYFGPFGNPKPTLFSYPDILIRLLTLPKVIAQYLWLILIPWKLKADYVVRFSQSWAEPSVLFPIFLLSVIGAAVFRLSKIYRKELFGLLWFFVSLLPVMNIVPINNVIAERYLYLPFVGVSLLCSSWLVCLNRAKVNLSRYTLKREGIIIIMVLIIPIYGGRTIFRNMDWRDDLTLWSKTIIVSPESDRAHNNLGNTYVMQGRVGEAMEEFQIALRLNPKYVEAHNNLGATYAEQGRLNEAIEEFQTALRLNPNHVNAHNNLGSAYTKQGRLNEAIEEYQIALKLNSNHVNAHYNIGVAYAGLGNWQEAIREWEITLSVNPDHKGARNNLKAIRQRMKIESKK